jgi:hypothetical protein
MGGYGSGRQNGRPTVEDGLVLDLAKLLRDGNIVHGQRLCGSLHWREVRSGQEVGAVTYEADLAEPAAAWMRLMYSIGSEGSRRRLDYKVHLTATKPRFGGMRLWFTCPVSGRRCAKLYRPFGGDLFASRTAWRLGYASQRTAPLESALQTANDRVARIQRRLGGVPAGSRYEQRPPRPKGMWRRTYRRLFRDIEEAKGKAESLFWQGAAAILERAEKQAEDATDSLKSSALD